MTKVQGKTRQTNGPNVQPFFVLSLQEPSSNTLERKIFENFLDENEHEEYPRKWISLEIGEVYTVEHMRVAKTCINETLVLKLKRYGEVWTPARVPTNDCRLFPLYPPNFYSRFKSKTGKKDVYSPVYDNV